MDFDKVAAGWDAEPRRVALARGIAQAILDELHPTATTEAMDFGCGTGLLSLALQPHVRRVTGIDASAGMLEMLQGKIRESGLDTIDTRQVDAEHGLEAEGEWDLVASSMALHHIRDTARLLRQFHTALRPGGALAIADLDPDDGEFHPAGMGVFHNGFVRAELRALLAQAGFIGIRDRTAASFRKQGASGQERDFSVFLMTARRSGNKPASTSFS